jgi:hypothetical protein
MEIVQYPFKNAWPRLQSAYFKNDGEGVGQFIRAFKQSNIEEQIKRIGLKREAKDLERIGKRIKALEKRAGKK